VDDWIEATDPQKHVFEDIGIATFLIALWKQDELTDIEYKFLDLGCGNGYLNHILTKEQGRQG
jgi:16S rRNA G1207 methylase RsmC